MEKYFRRFFWICFDLFSINIAFIFSIILRFGRNWGEKLYQYGIVFLYLSLFYIIFAIVFKLYSRIWAYISIRDLFLIAETVTVTVVALILYFNIVMGIYFPWTVKALTWFISVSLIGGSKLIWRLYWEKRVPFKREEKRILIVGAGDAGEVICREIEKRKDLGELVGFVDDDVTKIGSVIHNKKVLGSIDKISEIINKEKINVVVITIPSAKGSEIRRIVDKINTQDVKIKIVPSLYELLDDKVSFSQIRDVSVEDLLNRESINLNMEKISGYIKGKKIMVTGGAGSIGEEIIIQVCKFSPEELMILDHNENGLFYVEKKIRKEYGDLKLNMMVADIRDREKMDKIFKR